MISSARTLGAPVTEPGGNAARIRSPSDTPSASVPSTVETRCQTPGCGSAPSRSGTVTVPGSADAAEVVADQVHDHHVLGPVLGRPLELRELRGGLGRVAAPPGGALDRLGRDGAAGPAQEQLGRERRHRPGSAGAPTAAVWRRRRRRRRRAAAVPPPPGRTRRAGRPRTAPPPAGRCWPGRCHHRGCTPPSARPPAGARPTRGRAGTARTRSRPAARGAAARATRSAKRRSSAAARSLRPERLEPPLPRRPLAHQHVVVPAEPPGGQPARPGRRQRLAARRCSPGTRSTRRRRRSRSPAGSGASSTSSGEPGADRTTAGSAATTSRPPAQVPKSAAGWASARTRRSTSVGVSSHRSGRRTTANSVRPDIPAG